MEKQQPPAAASRCQAEQGRPALPPALLPNGVVRAAGGSLVLLPLKAQNPWEPARPEPAPPDRMPPAEGHSSWERMPRRPNAAAQSPDHSATSNAASTHAFARTGSSSHGESGRTRGSACPAGRMPLHKAQITALLLTQRAPKHSLERGRAPTGKPTEPVGAHAPQAECRCTMPITPHCIQHSEHPRIRSNGVELPRGKRRNPWERLPRQAECRCTMPRTQRDF